MYSNRRLILSIFWVILGLILLGLSIADVLTSNAYAGMGGAFTTIGIIQTVRNLKYRKDSDYRELVETESGDERNAFLRMKSWSWTGLIVILAEGIGGIAAMILGQRLIWIVLSGSVCLMLAVYSISYLVLKKKY